MPRPNTIPLTLEDVRAYAEQEFRKLPGVEIKHGNQSHSLALRVIGQKKYYRFRFAPCPRMTIRNGRSTDTPKKTAKTWPKTYRIIVPGGSYHRLEGFPLDTDLIFVDANFGSFAHTPQMVLRNIVEEIVLSFLEWSAAQYFREANTAEWYIRPAVSTRAQLEGWLREPARKRLLNCFRWERMPAGPDVELKLIVKRYRTQTSDQFSLCTQGHNGSNWTIAYVHPVTFQLFTQLQDLKDGFPQIAARLDLATKVTREHRQGILQRLQHLMLWLSHHGYDAQLKLGEAIIQVGEHGDVDCCNTDIYLFKHPDAPFAHLTPSIVEQWVQQYKGNQLSTAAEEQVIVTTLNLV